MLTAAALVATGAPTMLIAAASGRVPTGALVWSTGAGVSNGAVVDGSIYYTPSEGTPVFITAGEQPRLSPSGQYLAFKRENLPGQPDSHADIWVRNMDTGVDTKVFTNSDSVHDLSWAPDTSGLYFDWQCGLFEYVLSQHTVQPQGSGFDCSDDGPVYRPGDGLYWHNSTSGLFHLASGGAHEQVPGSGPGDVEIAVSPDSGHSTLAFIYNPDPASYSEGNLQTLPAPGTPDSVPDVQPVQLTSLNVADGDGVVAPPIWSVDSGALLAPATVNGQPGLWLWRSDGSVGPLDRTALAGPGVVWVDQVVGGFTDTLLARDDAVRHVSDSATASTLLDPTGNDGGPVEDASLSVAPVGSTVSTPVSIGTRQLVKLSGDGIATDGGFADVDTDGSFEDPDLAGATGEDFNDQSVGDWRETGPATLSAAGAWQPSDRNQSLELHADPSETVTAVAGTAGPAESPYEGTGVVDTGFDAAESVTVSASGTINAATNPSFGQNIPPDGDPAGGTCDSSCFVADLPGWSLIGRVGNGPWQFVGAGPTTLAGPGRLYLAMDDSWYGDNSGAWQARISGASGGAGHIEQNVTTVDGSAYQVSFDLAGDSTCGPGTVGVDVGWGADPTRSFSFDTTGHNPDQPGWTNESFIVTGTQTQTALSFTATQGVGTCGPLLDRVKVQPMHNGVVDAGPDYTLCTGSCSSAHAPISPVPADTPQPELTSTITAVPLANGSTGSGPLPRGGQARVTIAPHNRGTGPTAGPTTVVVALPDWLRSTTATAAWNCSGVGGTQLTCLLHSDTTPVAAGADEPALVIDAKVDGSATSGDIKAAVITDGDSNADDDLPSLAVTAGDAGGPSMPTVVSVTPPDHSLRPGVDEAVTINVNNPGRPRTGVVVSVTQPVDGEFGWAPMDSHWLCSSTEARGECAWEDAAPTGTLPPIRITLTADTGVKAACSKADPQGPICVDLRVDNGLYDPSQGGWDDPTNDRSTQTLHARLPVAGGRLTAAVNGDASVPPGGTATEQLTVANTGDSSIDGAQVRLTVAPAADTTVSMPDEPTNPDWYCAPDDTAAANTALLCHLVDPLAAGATSSTLQLFVHAGNSSSGDVCGTRPCVTLAVDWDDQVHPDARLLVKRITIAAAPPSPPDLGLVLSVRPSDGSAPSPGPAGADGPLALPSGGTVVVSALVTNRGGPTVSASALKVVPPGWTPDGDPTVTGAAECTTSDGLSCRLGIVPAGGSVQVTQVYVLPEPPGLQQLTAKVTTRFDADTSDNTSTLTCVIRPPSGAHVMPVLAPSSRGVRSGDLLTLTASVSSFGTGTVSGPVVLVVRLPHGNPAGTVLTPQSVAHDSTWSCSSFVLVGTATVACSHAGEVAGGSATTPVTISVNTTGTSVELDGATPVVVTATAVAPSVPSRGGSSAFVVLPGGSGAVDVVTTQPESVTTGGHGGLLIADVSNVGGAPLRPGSQVTLNPPVGLRLTLPRAGTPGWSCVQGTRSTRGLSLLDANLATPPFVCTLNAEVAPGVTAPPLALQVSAPVIPTNVLGTLLPVLQGVGSSGALDGPHSIAIAVSGVDPRNAVAATTDATVGRLTVGRPVLRVASAAEPITPAVGQAAAAYDVTITNAGSGAALGPLTFTQQVPVGTTATASGDGWTCSTLRTTLTCTRAPATAATLGSGAAAPAVHVTLTQPAPDGALGSAIGVKIPVGTLVTTNGITADAGAVTSAVVSATVTRPQVPKIRVSVEPSVNPLVRGEKAGLRLRLDNGGAPASGPVVVVLGMPSGLHAADLPRTDPGAVINPRGPPQWSCLPLPTSRTPAAAPAVICQNLAQLNGDLGTGDLSITVRAGSNAPSELAVPFGLAPAAYLTYPPSDEDPFGGRTDPLSSVARAVSALGVPQQMTPGGSTEVDVSGFVADAGPDQTVPAQQMTPVASNVSGRPGGRALPKTQLTPTVVTLDASHTIDAGHAQTFAWRQIGAGPSVTWATSADRFKPGSGSSLPAFPATTLTLIGGVDVDVPFSFGGRAVPDAWGPQPQFTVPSRVTDATTLTFRAYVTDGSEVSTDDVVVTVTPPPDTPPAISAVDVRMGLAAGSPEYVAGTSIASGTILTLTSSGSDADGDPVNYSWTTDRPALLATDPLFPHGRVAHLQWPSGTRRLVVTATAADGRTDHNGAAITTQFRVLLGPAQPTLSLTVDPVSAATAGTSTVLTPTVVGGDEATAGQRSWHWTQLDGPEAGLVVRDEGVARLTIPAGAQEGQVIHLRASLDQGTGLDLQHAEVKVAVPIVVVPVALTASAATPTVDAGHTDIVTAHGVGVGALTYSASVPSGQGSVSVVGSTVTFTAGTTPGMVPVTVTVTDAAGQVASQVVPIAVGSTPATTSTGDCGASTPLGIAMAAAATAAKAATLSLGPFAAQLKTLTVQTDCSGGASLAKVTFSGASLTVGPLQLTNVSGDVTSTKLELTSGTASLPAAWKVGAASITGSGVVLTFGGTLSAAGSLHFTGIPFVNADPAVQTTLTFSGTDFTVDATGPFLGGTLHVNAQHSSTGYAVSLNTVDPIHPFGSAAGFTLTGTGAVGTDGQVTYSVHTAIAAAGQPLTLVPGAITITSGDLTLDQSGVVVDGSAAIGPTSASVTMKVHGQYVDTGDWALSVCAAGSTGCTASTQLTLPVGGAVAGGFQGTIASTGGKVQFDLTGAVSSGTITVGPFTATTALTAHLSNHSADCAKYGAQADDVWVELTGQGQVSAGSITTPTLDTALCFNPSTTDYHLTSSVALPKWQPIQGVDVALSNVSLDVAGTGTGSPSFRLAGSLTSHGAASQGTGGGAEILALPNPSGGYAWVFDAGFDLSSIGLPFGTGTIGHFVYSTASLSNVHLELPGLDSLDKIALAQGFSGLIQKKLSQVPDAGPFLHDKLGLPSDAVIRFIGNFNGGAVTISGEIALPTPIKLFSAGSTAVGLMKVALQVTTGGTLSLAASACLHQTLDNASQSGFSCGQPSTTDLTLTAAFTLDIPNSTVSGSLTAQNWLNAFGQTGLNITTVTLQVGYNFATQTPTVGFGATIASLPATWAAVLGIAVPEPMQLVFNISASNPIFDLTLGVPDGVNFLYPLTPLGTALGSDDVKTAIAVDDAQLVIAPNGGDVGPYHYDRGFSLRFDGQLLGVSLNVLAKVDIQTASIDAQFAVGAVNFGQVHLRQTSFELHINPQGLALRACGGLDLGGSTSTFASLTASAHVPGSSGPPLAAGSPCSTEQSETNARPPEGCAASSGPISLAFDAQADSIPLVPGVASLDNLDLYATAGLGNLLPAPQLCVGVTAQATLFGNVHAFVTGSLQFGSLGITGMSVSGGTTAPVTIVPGVSVHSATGTQVPSGCTTWQGDSGNGGPSVTVAASLTDGTFELGIQGGITTPAGVDVNVCGIFSDYELALFAAADVPQLAQLALSGAVFYGSQQKLDQVHAQVTVPGPDGLTTQNATAGDFYITATGALHLAAFDFNGEASIGHAAGFIFAHADAQFDAFGSAATVKIVGDLCVRISGATCSSALSGVTALPGTNMVFAFTGSGSIDVEGFDLASGSVSVTSAPRVRVAGQLSLAYLQTSFSGDVGLNGGALTYALSSTTAITVPVLSLSGSVQLTNTSGSPQITGSVTASVPFIGSFQVTISAGTDLHFCLSGSVNLAYSASGTATLCDDSFTVDATVFGFGFHAAFNGSPPEADVDLPGPHTRTVYISGSGNISYTSYTQDESGCIDVGVGDACGSLSWSLHLHIDASGFHFQGSAAASGWFDAPGHTFGPVDVAASITTDPSLNVCATLDFSVWTGTICVPEDLAL